RIHAESGRIVAGRAHAAQPAPWGQGTEDPFAMRARGWRRLGSPDRISDDRGFPAQVALSAQAMTRPSPASLRKKGPCGARACGLSRTGRVRPVIAGQRAGASVLRRAKRGGTAGGALCGAQLVLAPSSNTAG